MSCELDICGNDSVSIFDREVLTPIFVTLIKEGLYLSLKSQTILTKAFDETIWQFRHRLGGADPYNIKLAKGPYSSENVKKSIKASIERAAKILGRLIKAIREAEVTKDAKLEELYALLNKTDERFSQFFKHWSLRGDHPDDPMELDVVAENLFKGLLDKGIC